jgi:uncharacterized protein (DUF488 family)
MSRPSSIYSVGHSTHPIETFLDLLAANEVRRIADIRRIPRSSRFPHFNGEALAVRLEAGVIAYGHFPDLGGRRVPRPGSTNTAWREPGFRGFADYMGTRRFSEAVSELLQFAGEGRTAVMCAEALWWRCHRRLLADALVSAGIPVWHIQSSGAVKPHQMSEFARERDGKLEYPGLV